MKGCTDVDCCTLRMRRLLASAPSFSQRQLECSFAVSNHSAKMMRLRWWKVNKFVANLSVRICPIRTCAAQRFANAQTADADLIKSSSWQLYLILKWTCVTMCCTCQFLSADTPFLPDRRFKRVRFVCFDAKRSTFSLQSPLRRYLLGGVPTRGACSNRKVRSST